MRGVLRILSHTACWDLRGRQRAEINGRQLPLARIVSFSRHSLQMPGGLQMSDPVIPPLFFPNPAAGLSLWTMERGVH